MEEIAVMAGVEVVKLLINLALQQASKSQMTQAQLEELYKGEKEKFLTNDPNLIPDPEPAAPITSA